MSSKSDSTEQKLSRFDKKMKSGGMACGPGHLKPGHHLSNNITVQHREILPRPYRVR